MLVGASREEWLCGVVVPERGVGSGCSREVARPSHGGGLALWRDSQVGGCVVVCPCVCGCPVTSAHHSAPVHLIAVPGALLVCCGVVVVVVVVVSSARKGGSS